MAIDISFGAMSFLTETESIEHSFGAMSFLTETQSIEHSFGAMSFLTETQSIEHSFGAMSFLTSEEPPPPLAFTLAAPIETQAIMAGMVLPPGFYTAPTGALAFNFTEAYTTPTGGVIFLFGDNNVAPQVGRRRTMTFVP